MSRHAATRELTGKPLIESDRVEGTTVYDHAGNDIGSIKRLMIEKIKDRVAYAVMSFGGFLGMGTDEHAVPWDKLTYDTNLGGYRTQKNNCAERQSSRVTAISIGAIGPGKGNCTTTIGLPTTGVSSQSSGLSRQPTFASQRLAELARGSKYVTFFACFVGCHEESSR